MTGNEDIMTLSIINYTQQIVIPRPYANFCSVIFFRNSFLTLLSEGEAMTAHLLMLDFSKR